MLNNNNYCCNKSNLCNSMNNWLHEEEKENTFNEKYDRYWKLIYNRSTVIIVHEDFPSDKAEDQSLKIKVKW